MLGPRQTAKADQKVDLNQRRLQLARTRGFTAPGAGEARRSAIADLSRSWIREVWGAATDGARMQGVALASATPCIRAPSVAAPQTSRIQLRLRSAIAERRASPAPGAVKPRVRAICRRRWLRSTF